MVGGGGKIGGGPLGPRTVGEVGQSQQPETGGAKGTGDKVGDSFERGGGRTGAVPPGKMGAEASGSTDVLRMARDNPAGARQLVATMAKQVSTMMSAIAQEMAGARALLEQLAAKKFAKKAREEKSKELRKKRDKLATMKMRMHLGLRKMALLQQIAGKLGDPRLAEELDRLLRHHEKLNTDWGRRHHLLSIASSLYEHDGETPEHLREVVRADVRAGSDGQRVGDALHAVSPRRVISELVARTLDGSMRGPEDHADDVIRGEHGQSMQTWVALKEIMVESLNRDPFASALAEDVSASTEDDDQNDPEAGE